MTIYQVLGNPNGQLSGQPGDEAFDVDSGPPKNFFVCCGGTYWASFNESGNPSVGWGGVQLEGTVVVETKSSNL
jgi:hypothetical protein